MPGQAHVPGFGANTDDKSNQTPTITVCQISRESNSESVDPDSIKVNNSAKHRVMTAAHIHLLLNHIPILGSIFGLLLLSYGAFTSSNDIKSVSLLVFVITALITIPVYLTGDGAARIVHDLPGVSTAIIERHDNSATFTISAIELLGVCSLIAWWLRRKGSAIAGAVLAVILILAAVSSGLAIWTGALGGQIRHTEVRS